MTEALRSCSTAMPKVCNAWTITRVSSESSAPVKRALAVGHRGDDERPVGEALGAGTRMSATGGDPAQGSITISAGKVEA